MLGDIPVVKVDSSQAVKGTPEYEALNNPLPNTQYELDNGTTFRTNESGFVDEISFTPVDVKMPRDSRQTAVGKEGLDTDVGGHIQACRYGGTCDRYNLFPQDKNFNNSAYKRWENEINRALQNGDNVGSVKVRLNRADPNNPRPDSLEVEYQINGRTYTKEFENQAGG
nr:MULTISPECIES: DNA/RNA non-specific endonuclease [unclassified Photobacterium]